MLSSADQEFDDTAGRVLNATWMFYPDRASKEGLHDYDGGMTDISPTSIAGRVREVETLHRTQLHRLDENSPFRQSPIRPPNSHARRFGMRNFA